MEKLYGNWFWWWWWLCNQKFSFFVWTKVSSDSIKMMILDWVLEPDDDNRQDGLVMIFFLYKKYRLYRLCVWVWMRTKKFLNNFFTRPWLFERFGFSFDSFCFVLLTGLFWPLLLLSHNDKYPWIDNKVRYRNFLFHFRFNKMNLINITNIFSRWNFLRFPHTHHLNSIFRLLINLTQRSTIRFYLLSAENIQQKILTVSENSKFSPLWNPKTNEEKKSNDFSIHFFRIFR